MRSALAALTLDDAAVWVKERERRKQPNHPDAPWFITWPYLSLCWVLDAIYANRPIQRFWFLETVARMPYFAYISMLHLYETLGWWRAGAELRRVSSAGATHPTPLPISHTGPCLKQNSKAVPRPWIGGALAPRV